MGWIIRSIGLKTVWSILSLKEGLMGCTYMKPQQYNDETPRLVLAEYFEGHIKAWGLVQDYRGRVVSRFDVDMRGTWQDNLGTLEEDFYYYSGATQKRIWTITRVGEDSYTGTADDVHETAKGASAGNTTRWKYTMDLKVGHRSWRVAFDDWLFLMNDGVLINRSYIKKFGFTLAELTLFMQKQPESE